MKTKLMNHLLSPSEMLRAHELAEALRQTKKSLEYKRKVDNIAFIIVSILFLAFVIGSYLFIANL